MLAASWFRSPSATSQTRPSSSVVLLAAQSGCRFLSKTSGSGIEEVAQFARAARVLQLAERLCLDLTDALAGHRELLPDLFERVVGIRADAEAHAQDALLARSQRGQDTGRRLAQIGLDRGVQWQHRVLVLDEIAEMRILLV